MEDKSIASGDFDIKTKTDRSDYPKYFAHGLVLSMVMAEVVQILSLASNMISSGFEYLSVLINVPPASTPAPMITGVFLVIIPVIGFLFLLWGFGFLNLALTERIWKQKQENSWVRAIGIGTLLVVCLLMYHILQFALLHVAEYGVILSIILTLVVFPMIDGVIGKNVTTLQLY
ncbi:MAG: hypothetical protein P1Q69_17550 [Candidatus Thorarchaeota archaeon]|nr:hypothetical protein [Candidatus Thorarchaeota archaeon]